MTADRETRPDPNGCPECGRLECPLPAALADTSRTAERWERRRIARAECNTHPRIDWQAECRALTAARSPSPPDRKLPPPWVVFHCEGRADILPAMRPGSIVEGLPLDLAQRIVAVANGAAPAPPALVEAARDLLDYLRDNELDDHTSEYCRRYDALRAALDKEPK